LDFTNVSESTSQSRQRGPLGRPLMNQNDSSLSPISEKPTLDNKNPFGDDPPRLNSIPQSEFSMPPARRTGTGSGVLPPIQTGSLGGSQDTSASQGPRGERILPERDFSSSPVPEHEPALPTPRPPTGESGRGPQSFGSFSVISGRAGTPPVVGPSPSSRSSFDVIRIGSPHRSQSPTSPPRSRMSLSAFASGSQSPPAASPPAVDIAKSAQPSPVSPPVNTSGSNSSSSSQQFPRSEPTAQAPSPPTSASAALRKSPLVGITLRDDQFAGRSPTTVTTESKETHQISRESPRPLPAPTPVRSNTTSTADQSSPTQDEQDESEGEYHDKPTVVPVTAISPAPRKRTGTPMFDGHPEPVPESDPVGHSPSSAYSESRKPLGRRPSGARAPPVKRTTVRLVFCSNVRV
jgi:hypothetical protein